MISAAGLTDQAIRYQRDAYRAAAEAIDLRIALANMGMRPTEEQVLMATQVANDMVAGAKTLFLRGVNASGNMVTSQLSDNGGALGEGGRRFGHHDARGAIEAHGRRGAVIGIDDALVGLTEDALDHRLGPAARTELGDRPVRVSSGR